MSKFIQLLEATMLRYQRSGFLPGDLLRFKKNWEKSPWVKDHPDFAKRIQEFISSGNNIRLSITKPENPPVHGNFGSYEQGHDVWADITLETAPGLYSTFMTVPTDIIEVVPLDNSLAPIPDNQKKKDPTEIKPSKVKPGKAGKMAAKDTKNQDVETDNQEKQNHQNEGDRELRNKNVKIPGGKKWDDKKPGGGNWKPKLNESVTAKEDEKLIFEVYNASHVKHARYGWIIDASNPVTGNPHRVGITGPRSIDPEIEKRLQSGEGEKFKMWCDGEKEPSFFGRYLGPKDEHMFAPKDDLGEPDCGCTGIAYYQNGTWVEL